MAQKIIDADSKTINEKPFDLLRCGGCGQEILVPPTATDEIVCPNCSKVNNKSEFIPLARTLWVSKNERVRDNSKDCRFSCVDHYRHAVRFRRAIFEFYDKQGHISQAQAIALLVAFHVDVENGVLKLLDGDREISFRPSQSSPLSARFTRMVQETTPETSTPADKSVSEVIISVLDEIEIKRGRGNQARSDQLVLMLDAVVLRFCPNSYVHLLRDALRLRSAEYKMTDTDGAYAKQDTWRRFHKSRRGVEASCRRLWKLIFDENPPALSELNYPRAAVDHDDADKVRREEWWMLVARQQGMMRTHDV